MEVLLFGFFVALKMQKPNRTFLRHSDRAPVIDVLQMTQFGQQALIVLGVVRSDYSASSSFSSDTSTGLIDIRAQFSRDLYLGSSCKTC